LHLKLSSSFALHKCARICVQVNVTDMCVCVHVADQNKKAEEM